MSTLIDHRSHDIIPEPRPPGGLWFSVGLPLFAAFVSLVLAYVIAVAAS